MTSPLPWQNTVYMSDASDMSAIPDASIDLVLTSPPYFNVKDYSKDGRQVRQVAYRTPGQIGDCQSFSEYLARLLDVWLECSRVLASNGKLVVNAPLMPMLKREYSTHENRHIFDLNAEIQASILGAIPSMFLMDTYIWNRSNPTKRLMFGSYPYPPNFYAQNTIEFVTVYVKRGPSRRRPKPNKDASKLGQKDWVNFTRQVWDIPVPNSGDPAFGHHSALMPPELANRVIRLYSCVGDTVLDPFCGSGTTLASAMAYERNYVGYEIAPQYATFVAQKVEGVKVDYQNKRADVVSPLSPPEFDVVHKSDAATFVRSLPSASVDLVCADPPYNLGRASWDTWKTPEDYMEFMTEWLREIPRILKDGGAFALFNTPENSARILPIVEKLGFTLQNWITWDKRDGFSPTKKRFVPRQETILVLSKGHQLDVFHADAVRVPYESTARISAATKTGIPKNGKRWFPNPDGKLCGDVWHIPSQRHQVKVHGRTQALKHPTPKPLALVERLVLALTSRGDVVLDPFAGIGTTALVAKQAGRRCWTCDAEPAYVEVATKALSELPDAA